MVRMLKLWLWNWAYLCTISSGGRSLAVRGRRAGAGLLIISWKSFFMTKFRKIKSKGKRKFELLPNKRVKLKISKLQKVGFPNLEGDTKPKQVLISETCDFSFIDLSFK